MRLIRTSWLVLTLGYYYCEETWLQSFDNQFFKECLRVSTRQKMILELRFGEPTPDRFDDLIFLLVVKKEMMGVFEFIVGGSGGKVGGELL